MKWEDLLKRDDVIGGDLETHEDGVTYRSRIKEVKIKGDCIYFIPQWVARQYASGNWEKWRNNICFVNIKEVTPRERRDGCIVFDLPYLGDAIIFPKGKNKSIR